MIKIPEELLQKLINELRLAQDDVFVKSTEELIQEAEGYLEGID